MKAKIIFLLTICLILMFFLKESDAKTSAYLVGTDGTVAKIDADTDLLVSTSKLEKTSYVQSGETSVVADEVNNHLFVVTGRLTPSIYVYDLRVLKFLKDLGIMSGSPEVNILVSPNGKQLYINWFVKEKKGWVYDLYDAKSLSNIKRFTVGEFVWGTITTFSPDGSKIYVYDGEVDKVQIHETIKFALLDVIDLNTIWRTDVFAQGVEDIKSEKALISETEKVKLTDPSKDTLFVYDLKTKAPSPRISTGMSGDEKISLDGAKIFLNEEQAVRGSGGNYVDYFKSLGRLHIYDVATGKKLGFAQFIVDKSSDILGIHPNGNKVYMIGDIQGVRSLLVMDIVNFKVTKTLTIPRGTLFMIFYNE